MGKKSYLSKIGWVRYRNSDDVVGKIKNVMVSKKCGRFSPLSKEGLRIFEQSKMFGYFILRKSAAVSR